MDVFTILLIKCIGLRAFVCCSNHCHYAYEVVAFVCFNLVILNGFCIITQILFSNYGYGEERLFSVLASFSECKGMRQQGSGVR